MTHIMTNEMRNRKSLSRRQFIRIGATATAGLLFAACSDTPPTAEVPATEAAQLPPTNTPVPPTVTPIPPTDTPQPPPTATSAEVGEAAEAAVENTPITEPTATPAPTDTPEPDPEQVLIDNMTTAATAFLASFDSVKREKAVYAFNNEERFRWHWTTPGGFPRNGMPLREMTEAQRSAALDLLQASLSGMGFEKSINIISLQNSLGNDPELYYVTVFGTPGGAEPWGWRWEGHHLSRHFTIANNQVSSLPFFLGSWPTTTQAGLRAMAIEEDAALELINSFSQGDQGDVIFQDRPVTQHVTQNAARVEPLPAVGVLYTEMSTTQQGLVDAIIQAYIGTLPEHKAAANLERIQAAGFDQIRFGWAGSLDRQRPQYYRLQGPTFLLEHDNTRNGGTHIHSVWRDFEQDFGYHLI